MASLVDHVHRSDRMAALKQAVDDVRQMISDGTEKVVNKAQSLISGKTVTRIGIEGGGLSDDQVFEKLGVDLNKVTALMRHVLFFVDCETGRITSDSIYQSFNALGVKMDHIKAYAAFKLFKMMMEGNTHITNIHKLMHSADTNVFDNAGNFNEEILDKLCEQTQQTDGVFTPAVLARIHQANTARDKQGQCPLQQLFVGVFNFVSEGEFNLLAKLLERDITVTDLKKFYTGGSTIFFEIVDDIRKKQLGEGSSEAYPL